MKTKLCNDLIEKGIVKENYVINHSYTNGLNGKNPNSRQTLDDYIETTDNSSPCLTTRPDTLGVVVKNENKIIIPEATKKGYATAYDGDGVYINRPHQKRGVVQKGMIQTIKTSVNDIGVVVKNKNYNYQLSDLRIRKLTPMECFKLMGVKPSDYNKITCSNAQKYKQAGNSIVTTVLMAIYSQLFENCDYKYYIEELLKELRTN